MNRYASVVQSDAPNWATDSQRICTLRDETMIFTATMALMLAVSSNPVDPETLSEARKQLEGYLSQIESIHLVYTEHWTPSPANRERARKRRKRGERS